MICSLGAPPKSVSGAEVLVSFYLYLQNQCVSTDFLQDDYDGCIPPQN